MVYLINLNFTSTVLDREVTWLMGLYVDFIWETFYVTESNVTRETFIGFLRFKYQDFSINSGDRVLKLEGLGL